MISQEILNQFLSSKVEFINVDELDLSGQKETKPDLAIRVAGRIYPFDLKDYSTFGREYVLGVTKLIPNLSGSDCRIITTHFYCNGCKKFVDYVSHGSIPGC